MSWLDRQSFLGAQSAERLAEATVGLVGLGGGNSHTAQQLAHLGVGRFILIDDDRITLTNLNRLVGGTWLAVFRRRAKVAIMKRMILAINPRARVTVYRQRWQVVCHVLKTCDVVVGGLDSVGAKDELDAFCRRFLVPYLDLGMDVHKLGAGQGYLVAGQVMLSMTGGPCLRCLGVVTDSAIEEEARKYGAAGSRPQVVWANGVLASASVGMLVQLLTPWSERERAGGYLVYDANTGTVREGDRFLRWQGPCAHHPEASVGDLGFDVRTFGDRESQSRRRGGILRRLFPWSYSVPR
jgi:hypothetical protein